MKYEQKITEKIVYSGEDIISWVRNFAAKQLGISPEEITDQMISTIPSIVDLAITVEFTKIKSGDNEK